MVDIEKIKHLRDETGVSPTEIKKALDEAQGDVEKARELLRVWGKATADKKTDRETTQGIIDFYIHPNQKTGVLVDIRCETDFVARSPEFKNLAHEVCLQIAALKPLFVSEDQIPGEVIDGEKKIYAEQVAGSGKPEHLAQQIIDGKLKKYKESISLLSQSWVKDDSLTIQNLVDQTVSKVGERIEIKRFALYEI